MIGSFAAVVAVGICFVIIIIRTYITVVFRGYINRCLNRSVFKHHLFDRFNIFVLQEYYFLNMFDRRKSPVGFAVVIRIVLFFDRALPGHQIRNRHQVIPAIRYASAGRIIIEHVILREVPYLLRVKRPLQCRERGKGPACLQVALAPH